jgi:1-acyl-sn-glycerol-3-phosphate acyltransferase
LTPIPPALGHRDRLGLFLQRAMAWAFTPVSYYLTWFWMRFVRGYRISGMRAFRDEIRRKLGPHRTPLLVCPNHLTAIDSLVLIWALGSGLHYLQKDRDFAWNLPERRNLGEGLLLLVACYLCKCIPVLRQGPPEVTARTMSKIRHLLAGGHRVMIFPEGTRSRSGRVDTRDFAYGTGRLVQEVPGTRVLCVYLRGLGQEVCSYLPRRGETFHLCFDVLEPTSPNKGLRGSRDISRLIVERLASLEEEWFANHRPTGQ